MDLHASLQVADLAGEVSILLTHSVKHPQRFEERGAVLAELSMLGAVPLTLGMLLGVLPP